MQKTINLPCLTATDAAYIAGIIDGEGTISLTKKHKNENRQLVVSISNTEKPLLEYIKYSIGAGKITGKKTYKETHTYSYTYSISNRQAINLLNQISPFLKTYKLKRAKLILRKYIRLTPRNGKYTKELLIEREKFVNEFFALTP